ncbi:MAG TPA: AI-2E family transporter [Candidatus Binatia bacterium]|nr:AI-2E family transporter [Candidatus Binatia bacterium]
MWTADLLDLAKRAGVVWAVGLLIILLVVGVGYAIDVLLLAFAGMLFAILLRGLSDFLSTHTGMGEKWSLAATVLLLVVLVTGGAWLLIPSIAEQTDELSQALPKSVELLEGQVKRYEWGRWMLEKGPEPAELIPRRRDLVSGITGVVSGTLGAIGIVVVIFFTGLFFAIQPRLYTEGIVTLVMIRKRDRAREVIGQIGAELQWWVIAKLTAMVFVGGLTWLGLWLLGIGMPLTLAVLAALLTFIPNLGPIIAAVPAVLIGLLDGPATAGWVVVLYVAIQTIESYLITPLLQQQALSLPPALTITAQLVMVVFVGGIGLALATPLTVVVLVLVRSLYVQDTLGDAA